MNDKVNPLALNPVESSNVFAVGYDAETQRMGVQFKSKDGKPAGIYHYNGVPPKVADNILTAKSVGSAVQSSLVRGGYKYQRIDDPKAGQGKLPV